MSDQEQLVDVKTKPQPSFDQMPYPTTQDELTVAWIAGVLQKNHLLKTAELISFETEEIGVGVGFASVLLKLKLQYDFEAELPPQTLICKFATTDQEVSKLMFEAGIYEGEYVFFTRAASQVPQTPLPTIYYANFNLEQKHFVLIMEDLAPAAIGDDLEGTTFEKMKQIVLTMADFHTYWWNNPEMRKLKELRPQNLKLPPDHIMKLFDEGHELLKDEFESKYPEYNKVCYLLRRFLKKYYAIPLPVFPHTTLVHGDLRLDNIFFPTEKGGRFVIIDWANVGEGRGVSDLTRIFLLGLKSEDRKEWETDLMKIYHNRLVKNGVKGYSFSKCRKDYSEEVIIQVIFNVIVGAAVDFSNGRGKLLFHELTARVEKLIIDYKVESMIKGALIVYSILESIHKIKNRFFKKID